MTFLHLLEGLRSPVLNDFFLTVTELGGETAFLVQIGRASCRERV